MDIRNIVIYIICALFVIAMVCGVGVVVIWPDPTIDYVPVTWYWVLGHFVVTLFSSKGSLVIYSVLFLELADECYFKPKRNAKVSTKAQLDSTRRTLGVANQKVRFLQAQMDRSISRHLKLIGIINLFVEKSSPNALAEIEQLVDLENIIKGKT